MLPAARRLSHRALSHCSDYFQFQLVTDIIKWIKRNQGLRKLRSAVPITLVYRCVLSSPAPHKVHWENSTGVVGGPLTHGILIRLYKNEVGKHKSPKLLCNKCDTLWSRHVQGRGPQYRRKQDGHRAQRAQSVGNYDWRGRVSV